MKTTVYFKQFLPALATLVTVGFASSCQDQNFDWDDAHAITAQAKFTDTFIKEYGKPAEGHQWGFDYQWAYTVNTRSVETPWGTDIVVVKPDNGDSEFKYIGIYGQVPDINEREHREVFDWFSTHKVNWGDKTTRLIGDYYSTTKTYKLFNGSNEITPPANSWTDQIDKVEEYDSNNNLIKTYTGSFYINNTNDTNNAERGKIVKIEWFDGSHQTRYIGNDTTMLASYVGTLYSGNSITPTGNTTVGLKINFTHAWVQKVADDNDFNDFNGTGGKPNLAQYQNDEIDVFGRANSGANIDKMTYLEIYDLKGGNAHLNDYNSGTGPGYGTGKDQKTNNNYPGMSVTQNGELLLGSNLNNLSIFNTDENKLHDKWIIVHLKGGKENDEEYGGIDTRYEGYYLGFDYEGAKGNDGSMQVGANGICNDWIFKITAVDPYKEKVQDCRIMCEDLGGLTNANVSLSKKRVLISDIDYNDIVFDVTRRPGQNIIDLTLQAAGGTLPLVVWYTNKPLFETHEFFQKGAILSDEKHTEGVDYEIMYNTDKNKKLKKTVTGKNAVTFSLYFNGATPNGESNKYLHTYANFDTFDVGKLLIRVWRLDVEDYIANSSSHSDAEWVNITNINGEAPLKLCVPQSVDWLIEREPIHNAYPKFTDWVGDPTLHFWRNSVTNKYLYNSNN